MAETDMQVVTTEKNGRQFKNLNLKTRVSGSEVIQGLPIDGFVIVEKVGFEVGRQIGSYPLFSCNVSYKGEECSIVLNEAEHNRYVSLGPVGTKIKITAKEHKYSYNGVDKKTIKLELTKVE